MFVQALRVSMEEQRQRQEDEARRTVTASEEPSSTPGPVADREEAMLQQALSMGGETPDVADSPAPTATPNMDFGTMSEEEQIAYAMQLSLQNVQDIDDGDSSRPDTQQSGASAMETDSQVW